jgi:hypothetical protein
MGVWSAGVPFTSTSGLNAGISLFIFLARAAVFTKNILAEGGALKKI